MGRLKEFVIVNLLLALFMIIMISLHPVDDIRRYDISSESDFSQRAIIYGDRSISQEFTCGMDCDSVEIKASAGKTCDGTYEVLLTDEEGNLLDSWKGEEIDLSGDWVSFKCRKGFMKAGKRYVLEVRASECDVSQALILGLGYSEFRSPSLGTFGFYNFTAGEEAYYPDKVLSISVYRSHKNVFAYLSFIIIVAALNLCLFWKEKGIKYLAPVTLTAACMIMMLSLSPGSGLDDEYHYYSAFKLSNIMLGRENAGEVETMYAYDLVPDVNANYNFLNVLENIRFRKAGDGRSFIMDGHSDRLKWPISHFAPAVGITIGRLLKMNFIQVYTLGRITSMIMYIILVLAAIRLTPVNKELMLLMASTPMVTQQAAQITYDTVINCMSFLLIGYIMYLIFEKKQVEWKDIIITVIIGGLMGPVKVLYAAIVLLVLAIPESSFLSRRDHIVKKALMIIPVFTITLLNKFSKGKGTLTRTDTRVGRPGYTIGFALHDPIRFIKMIIRSIEEDMTFYFKQSVGMQLGGRDVLVPEIIIFGFIIIIIICVYCEAGEPLLNNYQRVISTGLAVIGIGSLFALFVFGSTAYGSPKVDGLQGRYFIPFIIPLMYALKSEKVTIKMNRSNLLIPFWFVEMGCLVRVMNQINYFV